MQKIILICVLVLISQNLFSEEKKSVATLVATVREFGLPVGDGNGNLLAIKSSGEKRAIFLIGSDGQPIRQVVQYTSNAHVVRFFATKGNAVCLPLTTALECYSTEKEFKKLGELPEAGFGPNYLALKNGNVLVGHSDGKLKIVTPKGTIAFQTNLEGEKGGWPSEYPDGTIFLSTYRKKYFFSPELKLIKVVDGASQNYGMVHSAGLNVCAENRLYSLYTSKGDIKFSFNQDIKDSKVFLSFLSLPNGLTAFMLSDGYIQFRDADGNIKHSHFHDTEFYSNLVLVSEKVMAYWNKTEIVFLDLEGREIGTFIMPEARVKRREFLNMGNGKFFGDKVLIGLGNGTVVAVDSGNLHFIKMN